MIGFNGGFQPFKTAFVNANVGDAQATELAVAAVDNPQLLNITKDDEKDDEIE